MSEQTEPTEPDRLRSLFAAASVGFSATDPTGRFVCANDAYLRITGYSESELIRRDYQSITHPSDLPANLRLSRRLYSGEISHSVYEKRYINKQGDFRWVRNSVSVLHDAAGRFTNVVALTEHISDWRNSQREVQKSNDEIRRLVEPFGRSEVPERRRIAEDLEGDTTQLLVAVSLQLARFKHSSVLSDEERCVLSEGIALTERFCHYMAALARVLSPPIRISTDLRNALSRLVQRFTSSTGVDVALETTGDLDTLPSAIEAAVLSAAEKGLSEFQPDAHGGAVTLSVTRERERLVVRAQRPEMSYGHARRRFSVLIPIGD